MEYLTGEYQFRNEDGKLILQVKEAKYEQDYGYSGGRDVETWRDAKTEDLLRVDFCRRRDQPTAPPCGNYTPEMAGVARLGGIKQVDRE